MLWCWCLTLCCRQCLLRSTQGRPVATLLEKCNATVTICHSRTRDLPDVIRGADVVIAAIGKPEFIKGVWGRARGLGLGWSDSYQLLLRV